MDLVCGERMIFAAQHFQNQLARPRNLLRVLVETFGQICEVLLRMSVRDHLMRVGMERQKNAKCCNGCSECDGRTFLQIVMMILAAFEKNGGGDVHKNADHHREQLRRVWCQSG